MPEFIGVIEKVNTREGSGEKGPWVRYGILANGLWLNTFSGALGKQAQEYVGTDSRFKFVYNAAPYGNDLKSLEGPISKGEAPAPKAEGPRRPAPAEAEQRSISASVALQAAVATFAHTIDRSATPKDAASKVEPLARSYFNLLQAMSGKLDAKDVPF